jgi:hypothetical protein
MIKMALAVLLLLGVAVSPMAQTINLDMDTSAAGVQGTATVAPGQEFQVYLVVEDAANMTGVSADLIFDATNLELVSIREVPGDLNFDGQLNSGLEVIPVINQLIKEDNFIAGFDDFEDGYLRNSNVVYDTNNNQMTDGSEVLAIINELIRVDNFADTQYWTREVFTQTPAAYNESVEIFDPVSKSNTGGEHPGLVDDMTSVLLARPDRDKENNFGYSGDAIVATLTFKAKATAQAGTYTFSFPEAVWISNQFKGLADEGLEGVMDLATPATAPAVTVQ